jgi:hypothetical protein
MSLELNCRRHYSDGRDKVYALLSITNVHDDGNGLNIKVDYQKPMLQVFSEVVA